MTTDIQTFVFFDLETTGFDRNPRIMEISLIAISRQDLLDYSKKLFKVNSNSPKKNQPSDLPRVLHKYTRLFYPKTFVHPNIEDITGLSNTNLHHLHPFNKENAVALKTFLDFPPPVCLIAHNGNSFDFPILKAELVYSQSEGWDDILCADSLIFARYFEAEDIRIATEIAKQFDDEDEETNLVNEFEKAKGENFTGSNASKTEIKNITNYNASVSNSGGNSSNTIIDNILFSSLPGPSKDIFCTPTKSLQSGCLTPPHTPQKNFNGSLISGDVTPDHKSMKARELHFRHVPVQEMNSAKKTLYCGKSDRSRKPFSQPNLYERIFGCSYVAHRAEEDALALLQICAFHGNDFARWVDYNNKPLSSFKPKWSLRKSFAL